MWVCKATIVRAVVVVTLLLWLAESVECNCGRGNVDVETPQCVCACFADYLQPNCLYTADELVPIGVYLSANVSSFQSSEWIQTLTWALEIETSNTGIEFVFARRAQVNGSYARFLLRGTYAQQLLWDFKSSDQWLIDAGIIGVWEEFSTLRRVAVGRKDDSPMLGASGDRSVVVTLLSVVWLVAALGVGVVLAMLEWMLFSNETIEFGSLYAFAEPHSTGRY